MDLKAIGCKKKDRIGQNNGTFSHFFSLKRCKHSEKKKENDSICLEQKLNTKER